MTPVKQKTHISLSAVLCALVFALVVPLTGCNEDVTATLGTDLPFSLFGVLSPQLDSQWVRVYPIEERLDPVVAETLDAAFESTNLQTGQSHTWRDSVIQDVLQQEAHVFWVPVQVEYEHTYLLKVRRSDGAESSVEVTVPPRTEVVIGPPNVTFSSASLPISIVGQAPRLNRIEIAYTVRFQPIFQESLRSESVSISYDGEQRRTAEGWNIAIDFSGDFKRVGNMVERRIEQPFDRSFGLVLTGMTLRLIVANEAWNPPGGVFDPTVLVQPGTMTNVQNGFGFVGAGYRVEESWVPDDEAIKASGFRAP